MKKFLSLIVSLALISAVSCSEKQPEQPPENSAPQTFTAEQVANVAMYGKEKTDFPSEIMQVYTFMPYDSGKQFILLGTGTKTPQFWHFNSDFTEHEEVEFADFDIGIAYDLSCSDSGTIVSFVIHADYGDLPPADPYSADYDEELYDMNAEYSYMIYSYDTSGKLLKSSEVSGYEGEPDKRTNISGVYTDGNILIVKINGTYEMFNVDGSYIGEFTADFENIGLLGEKLICAVKDDDDKLKFCYIGNDGSLTDVNNITYDYSGSVQGIMQGTGEYDLFVWSRSTIFGIKSGSAEIVPLFNINLSGFTSDTLKGFFLNPDGNMTVMFNNSMGFNVSMKKYIPHTQEEMDGIPVITYGVCSSDGQQQYAMEDVTEWNDAGHDFMLELKFYVMDWENDKINGLAEDMLKGELPDILLVSGGMFGDINLEEKGALCDLYEFIDNDKEMSRESFVPNTLECLESNGKLYEIADRFWIDAGKVAKTKFVGDGDDWNFEKYVDMIVNPPVDIEVDYDSKYQRFCQISQTSWIDPETKTCNYDSESFIKYLKWCNIPENENYDFPPDYSEQLASRTYREQEEDYTKEQRRFLDDRSIFDRILLGSYSNYVQNTRGEFGGEDITFLEDTTLDFNDCLAIYADSKNKELAWEYIKSKISDESSYVSGRWLTYPFPITKSGLDFYENYERTTYFKYDNLKDDPDWKDYEGLIYSLGFDNEDVVKLGKITDDDVKTVNKLIENAKPNDKKYIEFTESYYNIMDEEIKSFFHGETTAEECARYIQDRVSTYLAEQY